jgi:hypothetical protein
VARNASGLLGWTPDGDYSGLSFTPPYPPGKSTYCVKGLGYRSFLEDCDRVVPGGRQALLAAIKQPALKTFLSQDFLAGSWFDIFPLPLGREVAARLVGVPMRQLARDAMAFTMKRDAATVYKPLLSRREPEAILEGLDIIARQYLSFSPLIRPSMMGTCTRVVYRDHFPKVLVPWCEAFSEGYTVAALKLASVPNPRVEISIEREPPASDGLELVQVRVATSWDA